MKVMGLYDCFEILIIDLCKMLFVVCVDVGDRVQIVSTFGVEGGGGGFGVGYNASSAVAIPLLL